MDLSDVLKLIIDLKNTKRWAFYSVGFQRTICNINYLNDTPGRLIYVSYKERVGLQNADWVTWAQLKEPATRRFFKITMFLI